MCQNGGLPGPPTRPVILFPESIAAQAAYAEALLPGSAGHLRPEMFPVCVVFNRKTKVTVIYLIVNKLLSQALRLSLAILSPVQSGLPRELAESLTRATQPGLVSPGGGDYSNQAQRYHPASLSSESEESLRHVGCYPVKQTAMW